MFRRSLGVAAAQQRVYCLLSRCKLDSQAARKREQQRCSRHRSRFLWPLLIKSLLARGGALPHVQQALHRAAGGRQLHLKVKHVSHAAQQLLLLRDILKLSTHFIRPVLVFHDEPVVKPIQGTAIQLARYIGHRTTHAKKGSYR